MITKKIDESTIPPISTVIFQIQIQIQIQIVYGWKPHVGEHQKYKHKQSTNKQYTQYKVYNWQIEQSKNYKENKNKTKVTEKINKCPTKVILHLRWI